MSPPKYFSVASIVVLFVCSASCFAESIHFDAPAFAAGDLVSGPIASELADQKIVQFVIPVSAAIDRDARIDVAQITVEIQWNRDPHPVVEFDPRTAMHSNIEGNISVEKHRERGANAGVNLSSGYFDMLNGAVTGGLTRKDSETIRYTEVPEQSVLISSGTIDRGSGVKFRFKTSRTSTLEGGRDLVVVYRVPETWRAGILQVTCRAAGMRRIVGSWGEDFDQGTTFVLPVYLNGDSQAHVTAKQYVGAEQNLRRDSQLASRGNTGVLVQIQSLLGQTRNTDVDVSIHRLIQNGSDALHENSRKQLPRRVARSAELFIKARKKLLNLNR